ncbi:uncharacterized protein LOC114274069 [Camellia sinensis]|uniref:uncharacterized protein LOC114274069 n=1 Tax=Camellia sinensis TaxID=4442 RepID=UPI0010356146|nr:uncharacterized protein LOC114274069 [Camellia sinensis]
MVIELGRLNSLSLSLSRSRSRSEQNGHKLHKAVSDVSHKIDKTGNELEAIVKAEEVLEQAECECCGLKEDCTPDYIQNIMDSHSDKWVCGLCSEAVKETLIKEPTIVIEEAVTTHRSVCEEFNNTRLNPKLSLTYAMRSIAKRSRENRNSPNNSTSMIGRRNSV